MIPVGPLTKAGVPTTGVLQVETATVVGTITLAGNATFTLTAAGMTGSPIAISVAVLLADTAAQVAVKAAAAIAANAVIAALFTITTNVADVIVTAKRCAANDATLNLAFTNGTCTGLTPNATSTNTTAGVKGDWIGADSGQYCTDTTNSAIYQNSGTALCPVWSLV